jgi:SAM-dependent methyltransferase
MSSKHGLLTWQDVETARLRPVVLDTLNAMVVAGRQPGQIRVLDLGCGRGITVIKLLQLGFDAYGVDIDAEPVRNGLPLLEGLGAPIAPGDRLRIYAATEPLPFPDTFFDLILSDQVFEHVARLSDVAAEMARVARADACGRSSLSGQMAHHGAPCVRPFRPLAPENKVALLVVEGLEPPFAALAGSRRNGHGTSACARSKPISTIRPSIDRSRRSLEHCAMPDSNAMCTARGFHRR